MSQQLRRAIVAAALLTIAACLTSHARAEPARVARFAVVLGNNRAHGVETLRYADDDALGMHRLFIDADVESRLLVTLDGSTRELHPEATASGAATLENLEREMQAIRSRIVAGAARGLKAEFFLFFSGHGDVEGGEGRLILEDQALTRSALYELLRASGADRSHVFLDACSSFMVVSKRPEEQRRQPVDPAFARSVTPGELSDVGFVLSSSSDRESHEWERYEAGIVSHELRSGLRGAADADLDGSIDYAELAAFMQQANRAVDIPRLRPDPWVLPPGKTNWREPVLSWRPGTVSVRVKGGGTGHFFVENARGERLLDAHPEQAQWLHLHLPDERPLYIRGNARLTEYELAGASPADVSELLPVAMSLRRAKGAEQLALSQLFAAAFGRGHVLEYEHSTASAPALGPDAPPSPPLADQPSSWIQPLGYTALTAALVGGALSTAAWVTYARGSDATQIEAGRANRKIERFHQLSLIPYATAAAAGLVWAWLKLDAEDASVSVQPLSSVANGEVFIGLDGRF